MKKLVLFSVALLGAANAIAQLNTIEAKETDADLVAVSNQAQPKNPVENFRVVVNGDRAQISWQSQKVQETRGFLIEKSLDGIQYHSLVYVAAESDMAGKIEYFETDTAVQKGVSYYRIRQVFDNGHETIAATSVLRNRPESGEQIVDEFGNFLIKTDFSGFENEETLVILRDSKGFEYFSKLYVVQTGQTEKGVRLEPVVPAGEYMVTASSNDQFLAHKLAIE